MLWRILAILICLIFVTECKNKQNEKTVIMVEHFVVDIVNKDLVKRLGYTLPTYRQLWAEFELNENVSEFGIQLRFDVIKKDNRNMNLMKHDMDGCQALGLAYMKITAIKVTMMELLRTSNLPKKCPLLANKLYYINNYTINSDDYPNMIPSMNWRITMKFFITKVYQGQVILKGEVRKH